MSDDRRYPPGTVPAAIVTMILIGLLLAAGALGVSAILRGCDRPGAVQMMPTPMPAASSAAIATSSAHVTASQSVRVTIRRPSGYNESQRTPDASRSAKTAQVTRTTGGLSFEGQGEEIVVEVSQAIAAAATSSAQASAATSGNYGPLDSFQTHGRLGVIAATMPGILAVDVELARVDVPPWLVGMQLELGLDVAANLEAGSLGVSAGSKAFALVGYWSRWNLSAQGVTVGAGLRF